MLTGVPWVREKSVSTISPDQLGLIPPQRDPHIQRLSDGFRIAAHGVVVQNKRSDKLAQPIGHPAEEADGGIGKSPSHRLDLYVIHLQGLLLQPHHPGGQAADIIGKAADRLHDGIGVLDERT